MRAAIAQSGWQSATWRICITRVAATVDRCRPASASAFAQLFANRWLWGAVALSLVLQVAVVHLAVLNVAFGTVPLTFDQWLVCAGMGSVVLWASELRKLVSGALRRGALHAPA